VVYLIGRVIYLIGYVRDPRTRTLGYILSIAPVGALIVFGLIGILKSIL